MRGGRIEVRLTGTLDGSTATGAITLTPAGLRFARCKARTRPFTLRAETVPTGAAAQPAPGSLLSGLTAEAAGGLRLPVALKVNGRGTRLTALWQGTMRCGATAVLTVVNLTPRTRIRGDATFSRRERYSIRYRDGSVDRYRVVFRGRLLADGAAGTLRARMQTSKPGASFYPCDSGTHRWTAAF